MVGIGTIINTVAIILGGLCGILFSNFLSEQKQDTLCKACGICVLFIGISGVMKGMLTVEGDSLIDNGVLQIIFCISIGALLGEILNIEEYIENLGKWLKLKSGNAKDKQFVEAFVTSSLTVCIGAMAVIGAIEDGIMANPSILFTKATLDFIVIMVMASSMGKGCIFSALPVAVFQGVITVLARFIKPIMTDIALENLSLIGSILIFCVGVNLIWDKKIRVANLLPSIVIAVAISFF